MKTAPTPVRLSPRTLDAEDDELNAIEEADKVPDPVETIIAHAIADPDTAFAPRALSQLAELRTRDPASFESLRMRLKKAGCPVTVLDRAIAEKSHSRRHAPGAADVLVKLAASADLFHAPDGTAHADIDVDGHRETLAIRSKGFRRWLARRYYQDDGGSPGSEALQAALNVVEAKALFDGPERSVFIRVGSLGGRFYVDLCDTAWRAVEIDAAGWRIVANPPVRFRRAPGMQPLPVPVPGGSVEALRTFLNVRSDADFVLAVAWALACLRDHGPYPVLVLSGEQGSAKSTFAAILRALVDPNTAPLRALPPADRDLFITANNSHLLAFDNLSGLPPWISDAFCRLATGGGFAVRQLYTDAAEVLFTAVRPVILTGIEDIVTRPDLADRAIFFELEAIAETKRRPEADFWADFEAERPRILGALLDAVSTGLRRLPDTRPEKLPRMADFAQWTAACESALWPAGTFGRAYEGNRTEAVDSVIEADPVASAIQRLMLGRTAWSGTATDLVGILTNVMGERVVRSRSWPDNPRAMSGRLRRAATALREVGIDVAFNREGRARTRTIRITACASETQPGHAARLSARCVPAENGGLADQTFPVRPRTVDRDADGSPLEETATDRANALKNNGADGADGADANSRSYSGPGKTEVTA